MAICLQKEMKEEKVISTEEIFEKIKNAGKQFN